MNIEEACTAAGDFLEKHVEDHDYFTPEADLDNEDAEGTELWVCTVDSPILRDGGILVMFNYGAMVDLDEHNPNQCAQQCMDALKQAHPEIFQFQVTHEVHADDDF